MSVSLANFKLMPQEGAFYFVFLPPHPPDSGIPGKRGTHWICKIPWKRWTRNTPTLPSQGPPEIRRSGT